MSHLRLFSTLRLLALLVTGTFVSVNAFAGTGNIFVTNEKDDTVSVINPESLEVVATIDVGERPRGIGFSPDGSELYVAVSEENAIAVIDPVAMTVVRKFESGDDPETFDVHPNGNIYISNEDDAKASVFDPNTGEQVAVIKVGIEPEGVAASPDGKWVVVTSESTSMLHFIGVPEHKIKHNVLVGARPRSAVFSGDSKFVYATSEISGEVKKIDTATGKIVLKNYLGDDKAKPMQILMSKGEDHVYVAGGRANKVFVLNADTLDVVKAIPVGKRVWGLALSADGRRLYSTDGPDNQVSVIDTASNTVIKTVAVGKLPWGVAIHD